MDKTITTAFMVIASMVMVILLFNAGYPAVVKSSDAMINMQSRLDDRMKSQVQIVQAVGELNGNGQWQDTNVDSRFNVFIWVKNIGSTRIVPVERTDVFFGPVGNFVRIPYATDAGGSYPQWNWKLENATQWFPSATVKITITFASALTPGQYYVKVVIPNGVSDDSTFSM